MKSTRVEPGNILKQLLASQLFFDYILKIIKLEFENDELADYVAKFVCIHDNAPAKAKGIAPPIQKGTTVPDNGNPYTKKIDGKQLTIMPVAVLADGRARVSFNKIT